MFWAEWDDTGTIVLWADGQKFRLALPQAQMLVEDLVAAIREDEK